MYKIVKSDKYKYKLLKTNMLRKYEDLNDILKIASKYQDEVISVSYIKEDDLFAVVIKTNGEKWHPEYYIYDVDKEWV